MEYTAIQKANSEIRTIDLKGKDYAMVPERVTAFRKLYPDGFITTEILENDGTTVLMQARVGYYDNGCPITLGTGFAQEVRGKGMVNGTSHIENCETSAVGRALGFLGLGINGGGICSAEELVNAIVAQKQNEEEQKNPKQPAHVSTSEPQQQKINTTYGSQPEAQEDPKAKYLKTLKQNALFAYGNKSEEKLNEMLQAQGVTMETMTGAAFKAINKQIYADIAANNKKEGAA
jgi:hypothetical protein